MYRTKLKRPKHPDYDLIVIGSGAGGGITAHTAAGKGKRVALIENDTLGGECPSYACIPTKALLQAAEAYVSAQHASNFGVRATSVSFNYNAVKAWKDTVVLRTGVDESQSAYKHENITVIHGLAHFIDPWTISVGNKKLSAHRFLVATGSHGVMPPLEGLKETGFITYREAINLSQPPRSIFIIGGGAIGCEFAQIFSSFGSRVHIAEFSKNLMAKEDPEVGIAIEERFVSRGVNVHTSSRIVSISGGKGKKTVNYVLNGESHSVQVEEILLATGKAPNTDLGLENAHVKYTPRGIVTNQLMESSTKHIYAVGDVTGPYMFTHTAAYQSRIAVHNMYSKKKVRAIYHAVPRVTYLDPEVAAVGATVQELKSDGVAYQIAQTPISIIARSNTSNQSEGFVKVLASHTGVLLGASIVAPRAGEMVQELTLAIHHGLKASAITESIHAFPTWGEAVRVACSKIDCQ